MSQTCEIPKPTTKLRHALLGIVRRAHHRSGWSVRELARRADVHHRSVGRCLRGRQVTLEMLERLLYALDVHDELVALLYASRDEGGRLLVLPVDAAGEA